MKTGGPRCGPSLRHSEKKKWGGYLPIFRGKRGSNEVFFKLE